MTNDVVRAQDNLDNLMAEHRALDRQVDEMGRRRYLTPTEQVEFRRLKKRRLAKKDLITQLRERKAS